MKPLPTKLAGLLLYDLEVAGQSPDADFFPDERGHYVPFANFAKLAKAGFPGLGEITQAACSFSRAGVIRGIHAEPWDKLIYVARGQAFVVEVDMRTTSPTLGQHETFVMDQNRLLFVPQGFGNSFQAMVDTHYVYLVNGIWSADAKYSNVHPLDPDLGIDWPLKGDRQVISAKDQALPMMRQSFPGWQPPVL
jgi:dTDP-4-dehydrorhamnose 3,5-epimerase